MRKGMIRLAISVQQGLYADPFDGAVFAFCGRGADGMKMVAAGPGSRWRVRMRIITSDGWTPSDIACAGGPRSQARHP